MDVEGLVPPVVTPTAGRSDVDREALRSFADHLLAAGVHGLFPCGSAGEFASLARAQRRRVIETVVATADGEVPVIAGCGHTSVRGVRRLVDDAAEAGADAAAVITPYCFTPGQDGLADFYERVANDSPLPIFLYNNPHFGGALDGDTVLGLADHDGIVGIKDSSGDFPFFHRVVTESPDDFTVLQGTTHLAVQSLDVGADGLVVGSSNVYPRAVAGIFEAHRAGDRERAVRLLSEVVVPTINAFRVAGGFIAGIKYLATLRGHDVGPPLPPQDTLSQAEKERLYQALEPIEAAAERLDVD